ncbi:MAG: hypothetical protein V1784_01690 [bacterium]
MDSDSAGKLFFFAIFALVAGYFIFGLIKYGGFKAAMFGAIIERTVGEVSGGGFKFGSIVLRVHTLNSDSPEKAVGLEVITKSIASYHMMPITLSGPETTRLAALLQSAAEGKHAI